MTEKEFKSVKIENIHFVRPDKEFFEKNSDKYFYSQRNLSKGNLFTEIVYDGPHFLDQVTFPGDLDDHYIKNSFKNFSFEDVDTSGDMSSLRVKLKLDNGSIHTLYLSNASIGSLLLEATIENGLIKSECCFIPKGYGNNYGNGITVNSLVVKDKKLYNDFLNKVEIKSDMALIKSKDLRTGQKYNICNKYEDISIFLGFVYEVKAKDMLSDTIRIAKKRTFFSYRSNDSFFKNIETFLTSQTLMTSMEKFVRSTTYFNPIENSPKSATSAKIVTLPSPKNMEMVNYNNLFRHNAELSRAYTYDPKFYFTTKEEAINFKKSIDPILLAASSTGSVRPSNYGYYKTSVTTTTATKVKSAYEIYFNTKTSTNSNLITFVHD